MERKKMRAGNLFLASGYSRHAPSPEDKTTTTPYAFCAPSPLCREAPPTNPPINHHDSPPKGRQTPHRRIRMMRKRKIVLSFLSFLPFITPLPPLLAPPPRLAVLSLSHLTPPCLASLILSTNQLMPPPNSLEGKKAVMCNY